MDYNSLRIIIVYVWGTDYYSLCHYSLLFGCKLEVSGVSYFSPTSRLGHGLSKRGISLILLPLFYVKISTTHYSTPWHTLFRSLGQVHLGTTRKIVFSRSILVEIDLDILPKFKRFFEEKFSVSLREISGQPIFLSLLEKSRSNLSPRSYYILCQWSQAKVASR